MPEKVGRWDIVLQIARGGMATVYLARARSTDGFDRYVALKLTAEHLRDDPEFAAHLVDEAQLVAYLRHPNVVPVLEVGEDDLGAVYLVMEYIPGNSLSGLVRLGRQNGEPLPRRIALRVLVDALAGLHAAHEHADEEGRSHRIVHRDFSPQNILVGTDGVARLTDFGIAKAVSRASVTVAGVMKGKIRYASPEQARGEELDRRCDVWAAGVITWELLSGRKLFPPGIETLHKIATQPPPRVRTVAPDVPAALDEAIHHALQMDLGRRTGSARDFAQAIQDGASASGLLASVDEVAAWVQRAVEPILAERRATIARVRAASIADLDDATVPLPHPPVHIEGGPGQALLPSLPELPVTPISTSELPDFGEPPRGRPPAHDRASARDVFGMPETPPPVPESAGVITIEPTPPAPLSVRSAPPPPARPAWRASLVELKLSVADRVTRFIAEHPALVIGGSSGIAITLVLFAVVFLLVAKPATPPPAVTVAKTTPPPASVLPSFDPPETPPAQLELAANAPIARVRVGRRVVDVEVPAPKVAVELTMDEVGTTLTVGLTSQDGRTATATVQPGDLQVPVAFGERPKPAPWRPKRR